MKKAEKRKLLNDLKEKIVAANEALYYAESNRGRMTAAQEGKFYMGQFVALTEYEYYRNDDFADLMEELHELFGEWAIDIGNFFNALTDEQCKKFTDKHLKEKMH